MPAPRNRLRRRDRPTGPDGTFPATFAAIAPPEPTDPDRHRAAAADYAARWRTITTTATRYGWTPADLVLHGIDGLDARRVAAGETPWSDRTRSHYHNIVRYTGLSNAPARHVPRAAAAITTTDAARAWHPATSGPAALRTTAIARIAWWWPAPIDTWLRLQTTDITIGHPTLTITTPPPATHTDNSDADNGDADASDMPPGPGADDLPAVMSGPGGIEWDQWLTARARRRLRRDGPALVTTRPGRLGSAGDPLSRRGFEAAWATHAAAFDLPDVSYNAYRLAALAAGAAHPGGVGARTWTTRTPRPARPHDQPDHMTSPTT